MGITNRERLNKRIKRLNSKHKKVLRLISEGVPRVSAYMQIFTCSNRGTATSAAYNIINSDAGKAFMQELESKFDQASIIKKEEVIDILSQIARGTVHENLNTRGEVVLSDLNKASIEEYNTTDNGQVIKSKLKLSNKVQAIKALSELLGWNKPQQLDVNMKTYNVVFDDDSDNISDDIDDSLVSLVSTYATEE